MTDEELQELDELRREKHLRTQHERARQALEAAGISAAFSDFLIGEDDTATDQRAEAFISAYQAAISDDVRRRLPQQSPVLTPPAPCRGKRGIQRVR